MFGYVTPYKDELKVKEYEIFKAYYCGLCKTLGNEFNQLVRFGLNFDLTFLALLLSSIEEEKDFITREGCIANPFKKKSVIKENQALFYSANISIILLRYKLLDDWYDKKSIKSLIASIPFLTPLKKANKRFEQKSKAIKSYLVKLLELENNNCNRIDEIADVFGKLMEEISVPEYINNLNTERTLRWIGYNLGRWIYILDAYNDLEEDVKNKSYNPIILQYNYTKEENMIDFKERIIDKIEFSLLMSLDSMAKSIEFLNMRKNREIIENIVYLGTRQKMDAILYKKEDCKHEKSI